jgi:hypothetical protein
MVLLGLIIMFLFSRRNYNLILDVKIFIVRAFRGNRSYKPNPQLTRALDIIFILHAEHEMNCSTSAVRHLASRYSFYYNTTQHKVIGRVLLNCYLVSVVWMYIQLLPGLLELYMDLFMVELMR